LVGRDRQAHPSGEVLAVGGDEIDSAFPAQRRQDLLDGQPAGLADDIADEQDPARTGRPRRVAVRGISESRPSDRRLRVAGYFAYSTARVSRMTVTLIWPGYVSVSSILRTMSRASRVAVRSSISSGRTRIRTSRPAWTANERSTPVKLSAMAWRSSSRLMYVSIVSPRAPGRD